MDYKKEDKAHPKLVQLITCQACQGSRRPENGPCIDCGYNGTMDWVAMKITNILRRLDRLERDFRLYGGGPIGPGGAA